MSLISFLDGRVISYVNSRSHFWLQPLGECKVALLDDATAAAWDYVDTYLRNMLDGNPVCLDAKHKNPCQIKAPPLLVTSNTDIREGDRWQYLKSRVRVVPFLSGCPTDSAGNSMITITAQHWKSFFERLWAQLPDGQGETRRGNGEPDQPFRCAARSPNGHI